MRYPVNYIQGHFSLGAPGGFGRGGEFDKLWLADDTPRFIYVTLQHPSPYYDDSYGVNSENNGPYGDAIMQELLPGGRDAVPRHPRAVGAHALRRIDRRLDRRWRTRSSIRTSTAARSPAAPTAVDFRYHQIVNIYKDTNAYFIDKGWMKVERPNQRRPDGNIVSMMKDENWYELVVGDKSRSGGQWDIWEATYSPVGNDGYPKRLWNKETGVIDQRGRRAVEEVRPAPHPQDELADARPEDRRTS